MFGTAAPKLCDSGNATSNCIFAIDCTWYSRDGSVRGPSGALVRDGPQWRVAGATGSRRGVQRIYDLVSHTTVLRSSIICNLEQPDWQLPGHRAYGSLLPSSRSQLEQQQPSHAARCRESQRRDGHPVAGPRSSELWAKRLFAYFDSELSRLVDQRSGPVDNRQQQDQRIPLPVFTPRTVIWIFARVRRRQRCREHSRICLLWARAVFICKAHRTALDRKSTRLNSSHGYISYAVFCLKKKKMDPDRWVLDIAAAVGCRA